MLLEELEWKLGGRIKSVLIVLLIVILMWSYAGGTYESNAYAGSALHPYVFYYMKCWERLCMLQ